MQAGENAVAYRKIHVHKNYKKSHSLLSFSMFTYHFCFQECLNPVNGQCNIECCDNPWQSEARRCEFLTIHGNNNNINSIPCGSSQCDGAHILVTKNNINAYAVHHGIPKEDLTGYRPELNQTENPHYFQINRLLYQAHLEKAHREGMTLKNPF